VKRTASLFRVQFFFLILVCEVLAGCCKHDNETSGPIKVKLSVCLTNEALRHEGVWGSGRIGPHFLTSALAVGQ
jgi:hypothetical protein